MSRTAKRTKIFNKEWDTFSARYPVLTKPSFCATALPGYLLGRYLPSTNAIEVNRVLHMDRLPEVVRHELAHLISTEHDDKFEEVLQIWK